MTKVIRSFRRDNKELTPVNYSTTAINARHCFKEANTPCFRIHWHERIELIRVRRGKVNLVYGTSTITLHADEMFILTPRVPHRAYTTDSFVEYDVLMFDIRSFYNDSELCKTYLPSIFDGRAKLNHLITNPDTIACFDELHAKWTDNTLAITSKIYWLLYLLLEHNLVEFKEKLSQDEVLLEVIQYIEQHYSEELSIEILCNRFGYSPTHLGRKFKKGTGLSPMNYVKIYRLETAKNLLKNSKRSVSEVARQCGFADANYFTRCFKAHFGVAPTQLLKSGYKKIPEPS